MNEEALWGNLLAQAGVGAVLAFFMWHLISVSIPKLIQGFREELATERRDRVEQSRQFLASIDRLSAHIENLTDKIEQGRLPRRTMLQHPRADDPTLKGSQ